jgi:hypothetical protein
MSYPASPGYVSGSNTSKSAAKAIGPMSAGTWRAWIYKEIKRAGQKGRTCEEIESRLHLRHQSASARIRELVLFGDVKILGTRENSSGRQARVYVAVDR